MWQTAATKPSPLIYFFTFPQTQCAMHIAGHRNGGKVRKNIQYKCKHRKSGAFAVVAEETKKNIYNNNEPSLSTARKWPILPRRMWGWVRKASLEVVLTGGLRVGYHTECFVFLRGHNICTLVHFIF